MENWKILKGATTAPAGKVWIWNGKSRFGREYKQKLIPVEDLPKYVKEEPPKRELVYARYFHAAQIDKRTGKAVAGHVEEAYKDRMTPDEWEAMLDNFRKNAKEYRLMQTAFRE